MKFRIIERKVNLTDTTKERVYLKLGKLDKFFHDDAEAVVTFTNIKDMITLEVTIHAGGMIYRAEVQNHDAKACVDAIQTLLDRQIRKNKTRLEKKLRSNAFVALEPNEVPVEEEKEFNIVKTKTFVVKPMSPEEAILQMNLLGHQFFMFLNAETDGMCLVYKRKDGNYALIETE